MRAESREMRPYLPGFGRFKPASMAVGEKGSAEKNAGRKKKMAGPRVGERKERKENGRSDGRQILIGRSTKNGTFGPSGDSNESWPSIFDPTAEVE